MIDLRLGDCLEVMKTIEDNSIDLILTDPPYGTTACKWDTIIDFDLMWEQLNRIIKPNRPIILFGCEPFSSALRMSNIKNYKYDWVWNKKKGGNPFLSKIRPITITENILVFNEKKHYFPIMTKRDKIKNRGNNKGKISETTNNNFTENKSYTHKYPKNIIEISNANQRNKQHPTQKPIELMEYLVRTYSKEDDTVLDFTMGSGSTMIACKNLNRNGIGIEKEEKYYNIAKENIKR